MKTLAQRINELPFYAAIRDADQLYTKRKIVGHDCIWKFADGSILTSHIDENTTEVLK